MRSIAFRILTTIIIVAASYQPAVSADRPPNIVFILADDLGYRELGCYGQEKIKTPHIDRLAAQGIRLTQHYSGNAVCAPSRCVLMTGKHPGHAAVRNNSEVQPEGQKPLPGAEVTLAELLKQAGYVTGAFGKWGLGAPGSEGEPLHQGFDEFFGYNCQRHAHSYYPDYLWHNAERIPLHNNPPVPGHAPLANGADASDPNSYAPFKGTEYAPDRIRDAAVEFLRSNKDRPFFLYFPSTLPHVALHVPDEELKPYLDLGWNDPPFTAAKGGYTPHFTPRAAYAAMISRLDSDVGRLLDELTALKLDDNTIVVFSSDNGATFLEAEVDTKFFASVGELRGLKGSLFEGGIRVPAIARWPGHIPAGSTSDSLSGFEDWLPTLCAGANVELGDLKVDGINLLPELTGTADIERPFLYREFPASGGQQSIRRGNWKAIRQGLTKARIGEVKTQLYNLATDPSEKTDLAGTYPEELAELEALMLTERIASQTFPLLPFDKP